MNFSDFFAGFDTDYDNKNFTQLDAEVSNKNLGNGDQTESGIGLHFVPWFKKGGKPIFKPMFVANLVFFRKSAVGSAVGLHIVIIE